METVFKGHAQVQESLLKTRLPCLFPPKPILLTRNLLANNLTQEENEVLVLFS
jgi:hypothetical protein